MPEEEMLDVMTEMEMFDEWAYTRGVSGFPLNAWQARAEIAKKNKTAIINMYQHKTGKLKSRIGELEKALRFYADESIYGMTTGGAIYMRATQPWLRARKVLENKNE